MLFILDRRKIKRENEVYQTRQQIANVENEYASLQGRVRGEGTVMDSPDSQPEHTYMNQQSINEITSAPESVYINQRSINEITTAPESVYEEISQQPSEHQ